MEAKSIMLSLCGELQKSGDEYICILDLESPLNIKDGTTVGLQDILLPTLVNYHNHKVIIRDMDNGSIRVSVHSDIVSTDTILGDQLLRSFCVKVGQRHYESPYPIMLQTRSGTFNKIVLHLKVKTCDGLNYTLYRGNISVTFVLDINE